MSNSVQAYMTPSTPYLLFIKHRMICSTK